MLVLMEMMSSVQYVKWDIIKQAIKIALSVIVRVQNAQLILLVKNVLLAII